MLKLHIRHRPNPTKLTRTAGAPSLRVHLYITSTEFD